MWQSTPITSSHCEFEARRYIASASSRGTPNLLDFSPVEMYGCVPASMSGFTRTEMRALRDRRCACSSSRVELRRAFDVEQPMPSFSAKSISAPDLPTPEKMTLARIAAGAQHALEFAARDDVEAGAERREQIQHREIAVRLHRIADAMRQRLQAPLRALRIEGEMRARIDIGGRAATLARSRQRRRLRNAPRRRGMTSTSFRQHARRFRWCLRRATAADLSGRRS